jgi:hypothetical protein
MIVLKISFLRNLVNPIQPKEFRAANFASLHWARQIRSSWYSALRVAQKHAILQIVQSRHVFKFKRDDQPG